MEIDRVEIKPMDKSINPELLLELTIFFQRRFEIPIYFDGSISSDENKKIANIINFLYDPQKVLELSARDARNEGQDKLVIKAIAPLNHKALDYLDTQRTKNPKGDIKLNLEIIINVLNSKVNLSHMFISEEAKGSYQLPENLKNAIPVFYDYRRQIQNISNQRIDMWILSGDSSPVFLELRNYEIKKELVIKSSDWIHDYCPVFQIGKFTVFEYFTPDFIQGSGTLEELINESIKALKKMEQNLVEAEWNQVIEDSRAIAELIRKKEEVKDLLKRDGYTDQAIEDLMDKSLQGIFDFASKFHHKLDKNKKLMPEIKASKEDAYLIYAASLGIMNLISKKVQRLNN